MTAVDMCRMVKHRLKAAGLSARLSPHSFRATTITDLLAQGVPLDDVQHLGLAQQTGERHDEANLYRLKGELLLALPNAHQAEAEACFRQAIATARRQSAKSWELRAVLSLSRLYHQQGKEEDARPMLAEIYGWFTEGFGTVDLQEAKALLGVIS
jgi:predicted ATPase